MTSVTHGLLSWYDLGQHDRVFSGPKIFSSLARVLGYGTLTVDHDPSE